MALTTAQLVEDIPMNASVFRTTRFELATFTQRANGFAIKASERNVHGTAPPELEIPESSFTDVEMAQIHDALALLETKFEAMLTSPEASPAVLNDQLAKLLDDIAAKKAEAAALDADIAAKKAAQVRP